MVQMVGIVGAADRDKRHPLNLKIISVGTEPDAAVSPRIGEHFDHLACAGSRERLVPAGDWHDG
jgi:hypothetical protein